MRVARMLPSVAARVLWGIVADRALSRRATLGVLGVGMGITAACGLASGPHWPLWALFAFGIALGTTAVGWNGVFLAELTRLAPQGRIADVTGGSSFFTFLGVVVAPPLFHFALGLTASYGATYALFGIVPLAVGVALLLTDRIPRNERRS